MLTEVCIYSGLSNKAKHLLNTLWIRRDRYNYVTKSYEELMALSGISDRRTLVKAKEELMMKGLLKIKRNYSKNTGYKLRNRYKLIAPKSGNNVPIYG